MRDLRTGQGGRAPPQLHRPAGLSPTASHRRRHRRGADVSAARGPGQHARLRNLIEAIPEADWTSIPYRLDGAADVAETTYTPFKSEPDAVPVRLIVSASPSAGGCSPRPVPNWPASSAAAITASSPTGTGRPWNWRPTIAATPRSRMSCETSSTAWGSTISPQGASPPTLPGCRPGGGPQPRALDRAHRSGRAGGNHQDPSATFFSIAGRSPARRAASPCICPSAGPGETSSVAPWHDCVPCHCHPDSGVGGLPIHHTAQPPGSFASSRSPGVSCRLMPWPSCPTLPLRTVNIPLAWSPHPAPSRIYRDQGLTVPFPRLSSLLPPALLHPFGGFGLRLAWLMREKRSADSGPGRSGLWVWFKAAPPGGG